MKRPFTNEPLTDFSQPANVEAFSAALDSVRGRLGPTYPLIIGGEKIFTEQVFTSTNPAKPSEIIGRVSKATPELADRAVRAAAVAFETWRRVPAAERARYLFSAAKIMRQRKHEFSALMVLEAGKTWVEADADTAEAIDFMEFYGREMLRLCCPLPTLPEPAHETELHYIPLGVGVAIPPWNFPNAIMTGMTTATIVSGNTAVLKPASATPVIAAWLAELLTDELHLPPGVLNFVPGPGGAVGDVLVDHPLARFIVFTLRQPVPEPQMHPRPGRRSPLRRLQHERHRLQGRRQRLPAAVHTGQSDQRAGVRLRPDRFRKPVRSLGLLISAPRPKLRREGRGQALRPVTHRSQAAEEEAQHRRLLHELEPPHQLALPIEPSQPVHRVFDV